MNDDAGYFNYYTNGPENDGNAGDENNAGSDSVAGDANNERVIEFAILMLLLVLKVSLYIVEQICKERGYDVALFEIIQFS